MGPGGTLPAHRPGPPRARRARQESAEEAAELKCIAEAEEKAIADDKFDDYVSNCIEKALSSK